MTLSVFTKKYEQFRNLLIQYRKDAGVTQNNLAEKLDQPQSYVSKFESGERRLDVIEFLDVADALRFDVHEFLNRLNKASEK